MTSNFRNVTYYATGDVAWEDLKAAEQDTWADTGLDRSAHPYYSTESTENTLSRTWQGQWLQRPGARPGYDPATNTLSYLCHITGDDDGLDFTAQPLTLLVTPPVLRVNGVDTAVTDHPAILTFQPIGSLADPDGVLPARRVFRPGRPVPHVHLCGSLRRHHLSGYGGDLVSDTSLVLRDGSILPAADLILGLYRQRQPSTRTIPSSSPPDFTSQFQDLLDVSQVTAVRVGDVDHPPGMIAILSRPGALPRDEPIFGN